MKPFRALSLLVAGLAACTPVPVEPTVLLPEDLPPILPVCDDISSLGTVRLVSPEYNETIGRGLGTGAGFVHDFQWDYDGDCWPSDGFRLMLSEDPDRLLTLPTVLAPSPGSALEHPSGLEYGREYFWTIAPIQDGEAAPAAAEFGTYPGATPHRFRFFTGPICDVTDTPAPELVSPENGEIVASLIPVMEYTYPGRGSCVPDRFSVDLSTDPGFATGSPWSEIPPATSVWPAEPLLDCTRYFWRVRALGEAGVAGPYSDLWSFYTSESPSCPPPEPLVSIEPEIGVPFPAHPIEPLACRLGPAPGYPLVHYVEPEDSLSLIYRDFDASWVQSELEGWPVCWVPWEKVEPEDSDADPMALPLGNWGPLPTDTPEDGGPVLGCMRVLVPNGPKTCTPGPCGPYEPQDPCTL